MRRLFAVLAVVGLLALAGWPRTNAADGGGTFRVLSPARPTMVKAGSSATITIQVKRSNFQEDLQLSASVLPPDKGVTAQMKPKTQRVDDSDEVRVTVLASDKTPPGEYKVKIVATPGKGVGVDVLIPIKVPETK